MAYGLETFNAAGVAVIRVTDRLTRIHSVINVGPISGGGNSTSVSVSGISTDGTWAVLSSNVRLGTTIQSGSVLVSNQTDAAESTILTILRV